mmetsp:Transcript_104078/g.264290  ORF Transcript_104078/g.264290 Transcript_104078/m.264290 type:complete len:364 (+) Transcript_104078:319-1410(+)
MNVHLSVPLDQFHLQDVTDCELEEHLAGCRQGEDQTRVLQAAVKDDHGHGHDHGDEGTDLGYEVEEEADDAEEQCEVDLQIDEQEGDATTVEEGYERLLPQVTPHDCAHLTARRQRLHQPEHHVEQDDEHLCNPLGGSLNELVHEHPDHLLRLLQHVFVSVAEMLVDRFLQAELMRRRVDNSVLEMLHSSEPTLVEGPILLHVQCTVAQEQEHKNGQGKKERERDAHCHEPRKALPDRIRQGVHLPQQWLRLIQCLLVHGWPRCLRRRRPPLFGRKAASAVHVCLFKLFSALAATATPPEGRREPSQELVQALNRWLQGEDYERAQEERYHNRVQVVEDIMHADQRNERQARNGHPLPDAHSM